MVVEPSIFSYLALLNTNFFMSIKRSNNLCSTYMLPLVGFKYTDFGETNFITSYVDETNTYIIVKLKYVLTNVKIHPLFRFEFTKDGANYAVFEVPKQFKETLEQFRSGKYSEFSNAAKSTIKLKSNWHYRDRGKDGKLRSTRELCVLYKDPELRKHMEVELNEKISEQAELASIPGDDNFFELNLSRSLPNKMVATNLNTYSQ